MLKIHCAECGKTFLWTDDMPLKGPCPNPDCEGSYDVHQSLRQSVSARSAAAAREILCPACGERLASRWTLCRRCGRIVAGGLSFCQRDLILAAVLAVLLGSMLFRYVM